MPSGIIGVSYFQDIGGVLLEKLKVVNFRIMRKKIKWPCHMTCRISVPRPGIETGPVALEVPHPNLWTARELPRVISENFNLSLCCKHHTSYFRNTKFTSIVKKFIS